MPKGIDWVYLIYVNLGFFALTISIYIYSFYTQIKEDWPKYRCNPMFMPLSDDIQADFVYCVQNMQTNFMGYLLEPLTYITSSLSNMGFGFTDAIDSIRIVISNIRTFIASISDSIMGVFVNITVESQKLGIGLQHLIGKIIGTVVTLMYIMEGTIKTTQSTWNGPPGQTLRYLGSCFDPSTLVKLKNGSILAMKDIQLNDVLENGAIVKTTMKIATNPLETFYSLPGGVNEIPIYVTGTHYILYKTTYIQVSEHPDAIKCPEHTTEYLSCLVTSDHSIVLGNHHFYDWEDYRLQK